MSVTSQQNINQVQSLSPGIDAGGLFRLANDGDFQACAKVASGEGGPDFICTAVTTAADTVNFDIPFVQLLKLYPLQLSGITAMSIRVKAYSLAALAANTSLVDQQQAFIDIAGAMTVVGTQAGVVIGAANTAALTNNGSNTLRCAVTQTGAVAHAVRVEIYVNHVQ